MTFDDVESLSQSHHKHSHSVMHSLLKSASKGVEVPENERKAYEDKIQKLEYEVHFLKRENSE